MRQLVYIAFLGLLTSCTQVEDTTPAITDDALPEYEIEQGSGTLRIRKTAGIELRAEYLSPQTLAQRELSSSTDLSTEDLDSLIKTYSESLTFQLTIGPDRAKMEGDIMSYKVKSYSDYKDLVQHMNFDIEAYITLNTDGNTYKPRLSHMEAIYGMKDSRDILLVFVPEDSTAQDFFTSASYDLEYDDEVFGTGINHFRFKGDDLQIKNIATQDTSDYE